MDAIAVNINESGRDKVRSVQSYIVGLDYLRVAAVFAVVWIHGSDTNSLAKSLQSYTAFAVPCFLIMSVFLTQRSCVKRPAQGYFGLMASRIERLIPAYLAWSLLYILLRFAKRSFITHLPFEVDWLAVIFFGGASYQLWFVPALLVWTAAFAPFMLIMSRTGQPFIQGLLAFFSGWAFLWLGREVRHYLQIPSGYEMIGYMVSLTGYIFIGMGLWALCNISDRDEHSRYSSSYILPGIVGLSLALISIKPGILGAWFTPLYSVGLFVICLCCALPSVSLITRRLSPCAFGIYLSHGIFVEGFQVVVSLAGVDVASFGVTVAIIVASFVVSAALCVTLRNMTMTRWLVA